MYWKLKLKAILHDPPYKAVSIKEHEEKAQELFDKVLQTTFTYDELNRVIIADKLSSAQSRIIVKPQFQDQSKEKQFETESQVNYDKSEFIDIFSERKEPIQTPDEVKVQNLFNELGGLSFPSPDERAKFIFLFLWRFYPEIFPEINKHPADSRAPNHSIYDHLVQTSAIVSALPSPAFLLFTIGPVQSFISKARKTSDLWSGSYMLSYLIWESMKILVEDEELGPDVIIFPNLFGQPLIDRWLCELKFNNQTFRDLLRSRFGNESWFRKFIDNAYSEEKLTIANLPNRFLAVIPYDKNLAERCEEKFRSKLKELAQKVYDEIIKSSSQSLNLNPNLKNDIEKHLLSYFQVYWVIMPWSSNPIPKPPSKKDFQDEREYEKACEEYKMKYVFPVLEDYRALFSENDLYKTIEQIVNHPYYKPANVGSAYSLLLELTEKLLGARKSVRDFEVLEQPGEKCHLCGEFEILWFATDSSKWKTPDGKIKLDEKIKDWNNYKAKNDEIWENLSKSNKVFLKEGEKLCGVCLTKRLFPRIIKDELNLSDEIKFPSTSEMASIGEKRRLEEKLKKEFANSIFKPLKDKLERKRIFSISVPKLKGDPLYDIDGQFLMKETYRKEYFEKEYGIQFEENESEKLKEFLKNLEKLRELLNDLNINPSKYYAILQMDGDNMGKWLRGEFNPKIENTIHSKVKDALIRFSEGKDKESLQKILCSKHPTSPSIHQAFSRKLSQFALEEVRKIVEDEHYGKLIYSGGDDVLAFLPIEEVLKCAYDLQKKFKEVLSPKASMSAGIVIVHHKYPLYLALEEVNNAEKKAKKHYGKNAFCLRFLSHGGEPRECGGNWEFFGFIDELICKFKNEEISSRFPYDYFEIVEELYDKNNNSKIREILKSELERVFFRKVGDKNVIKKFFEEEILKWFNELDIYNFANLLLICRKIAGEVRV